MKYDEPQDIWEGVTPCAVHHHMMQGCEHCVAEMTARGAIIDQMSAEAQERMGGLAQQGVQMPPWLMLEAKIDVLLDSIMQDPKDRMRYEGEVGRRIMLVVKDVQKQAKQPTLHVARNGEVPNLRRV